MSVLIFTLLIFLIASVAGLAGSLTGLGGGFVIIPFLTIVFKVDIHYAIGTSLISVIATSSGAAAAYVKEGITNIRLGMFLELATTIGAIIGAYLATFISPSSIAIIFGIVLIFSAITSLTKRKEIIYKETSKGAAQGLKLNNTFPDQGNLIHYGVKNVTAGFAMMNVAGIVSGLLGIGSGALKVIAMDRIMKVPFKVSTTTSNFMIGVTAAASAGIYMKRGYIDPGLSLPVVIGVLIGAFIGSKILFKAKTETLKIIFSAVIFFVAAEMIYNGITKQF